jgi:hypothetical protein
MHYLFCFACGGVLRTLRYEKDGSEVIGCESCRLEACDRKLTKELNSVEPGALIRIRYLDHVLQRNVEPDKAQPIIREAIGRLERENQEYVYLVVDEYTETQKGPASPRKTTGFVILRSAILEIKMLQDGPENMVSAVHCVMC